MPTPVWTGQELEVLFFRCNNYIPIGIMNMLEYTLNDTPALSYCFWQDATITKNTRMQRIPSTDRPVNEIVTQETQYSCSISSMYCKQEEFSSFNLFNRKQRWLIVFFSHSLHPNRFLHSEQSILYGAMANSGSLSHSENGISQVNNLTFWAEDFFEAIN
jgi:hypothetical protein